MRLICPSCDAQYEIDAALIPAGGRDVQCSNCGRTWFQEKAGPGSAPAEPKRVTRPRTRPDPEISAPARAAPTPEPTAEAPVRRPGAGAGAAERFFSEQPPAATSAPAPAPAPVGAVAEDLGVSQSAEPEAAPVHAPSSEPDEHVARASEAAPEHTAPEHTAPEHTAPEDTTAEDTPADNADKATETASADGDLVQRPSVGPAALGILKAEAEREIAARRSEAAALETQPDLGIDEPASTPDPEPEIAARTQRLRGDDPTDDGTRKELLPDIEEINSTLTATSDRAPSGTGEAAAAASAAIKRRSGFRFGFSVMMLATAALILLYLYAPQLAGAVPTLEEPLAGYVDWANQMRERIDGVLQKSVDALSGLLPRTDAS